MVMARQEHIHIVSAGEKIHDTYTAAIRDLQDITHTFVFADTALYTNSALDDERTKAAKTAVRDAVNRVKTISLSVSIPASLVYIDPPADVSVKKAVQKIFHDHPGARYTFDLSEGSKDLALALFLISLWLHGDVYTMRLRDGRERNRHRNLASRRVQPGMWETTRTTCGSSHFWILRRARPNPCPGCCPGRISKTSWRRFTCLPGKTRGMWIYQT